MTLGVGKRAHLEPVCRYGEDVDAEEAIAESAEAQVGHGVAAIAAFFVVAGLDGALGRRAGLRLLLLRARVEGACDEADQQH